MSIRIWILIIVLALAFLAVAPWQALEKGIIVRSVERDSPAFNSGLRQGMIIQAINSQQISNLVDYTKIVSNIPPTIGNMTKFTVKTSSQEFIIFTNTSSLDITVDSIPKTKIKTGLDLSGGARALVKPINVSLSSNEIDDLISVTSERLNVYGISDITIRPVADLAGNNYMLVEIAGATPTELRDLVGKEGKFEAKIGNDTVFAGGKKDIASVCRTDATCSRIESCSPTQDGGYGCRFVFTVYLSEEAAKRHADITGKLGIDTQESGRYLDKKLDLLVDDKLVDSLLISEGLKGQVTTQVAVSGSGVGKTREEAIKNAQENMHKLQTIMITGSLPYKLEIVKLDTISPALGKEFLRNIILLGAIVFFIVSVILLVKYRKIKITLAVILTMFSEAFITIAIAALIKWNLDAPSIAGIIAGMGTGVNDQIVMISEAVSNEHLSLRDRIKRGLFIIVAAFFTIVAAMMPLFWAGAGMLRGFALTTIIGVSVGIVITRPAFAEILRKIQSKE